LTDALNSVIAQTREDQSIQSVYGYSPYGQTTTPADDEGNSLEYTGRENDGTGIYFYRARYYDPVLKRFVQSDPIGLKGGLNTYLYAMAAPTTYTDPDGLQPSYGWPWAPQPNWNPLAPPQPRGPLPGPFPYGYCGSGMNVHWVPDGPWGDACRKHDQCYDTCGADRWQCDKQFLFDMYGNVLYFAAVRWGGEGPYGKAQKNACSCW